jgi:hypothetical protein
MNQGNISAISTYLTQSGKRRLFLGNTCKTMFSETRGTVFFDLRSPEDKGMRALKMLLVKVGLTDMGVVLGVTEATSVMGLERAAQKVHEINASLLRELPVTEGQRDEMGSCIRRQHTQQAEADGASRDRNEDGRQWVWRSCAPEFRRILATFVGPRTLESAWPLLPMTAAVVLGVPCFFSDGCSGSLSALIAVYHPLKTFEPTGKRGRPKHPVQEPHPDLV